MHIHEGSFSFQVGPLLPQVQLVNNLDAMLATEFDAGDINPEFPHKDHRPDLPATLCTAAAVSAAAWRPFTQLALHHGLCPCLAWRNPDLSLPRAVRMR